MILFILGVIGMTHILVDSEIMEPVDEWAKGWATFLDDWIAWDGRRPFTKLHHGLFECYQCSGFPCGVVMGLFTLTANPLILFACGCAGSFLADLGKDILDRLEGVDGEA